MHLTSGAIDFDFGDRGETNGFDAWRLAGFAEDKLSQYGFKSEDELLSCFKAEVAAGRIVYSGYILHYLRNAA